MYYTRRVIWTCIKKNCATAKISCIKICQKNSQKWTKYRRL